ncbi:conserved exported hypothetical protein [uncultured Mycobacterium sp.]|uniref:Uncharacterized protein n=1 Tax=uncultured Mycobacterium sp. TaxID=171292 RepID=A0A1Y5PU40_9MYCO|nr:conserved exported hypothetical protein [uncultured Mycobacterium sp.]
MKSPMLTTRAAAVTVALGLGAALASAATPIASADSSGHSPSSADSKPTGAPKAKTGSSARPKTGHNASAPTELKPNATLKAARPARTSAALTRPQRAPLTDTSESPANWLMAAAARREVDLVGDVEEAFRRIDLATTTLLAPIKTLVAELTGARQDDPIPPGACEDGDCNPTSDIYLPWVRNEITVLNLTGKPVTLSDLETRKPLTYGPQEGFVLDNARQVEMAFYQNSSSWDEDWTYEATVKWSDGSATVSVDVDAGGSTASSSSGDMQVVVFDTPEPINGTSMISERQTIVLLPKAGTEITIAPSDAVGQAIVAEALCKVSGSCGQEVVDEQIRLSPEKLVGNTLFNDGSVTSTNRYKVAQEVVKTSGVEENLKIVAGGSLNFSLGPLTFQTEIGALIQQKYAHSWSDGITTESQVDLNVPAGSYGQIYVQYPEYHDYVNMTLTNAGVTINIPDVEYISLAPSGSLDPDGTPLAVTYTTYDWKIGEGPHPYPDSGSVPTPPATSTVDAVTPPDIAPPAPATSRSPKTLGQIIGNYLQDQARAFRTLPNILVNGRAISSETFRIVNLTPYAQTLNSITGEYEEDESPEKGFVLQPFQAIDIEVDYDLFQDQETYVTWTNATGIDVKAELKVYNGGSDPRVTCQSAGCFEGGWDSRNQFSTMYIVYPYDTPGIMDVTNDQNLAGAAVDSACTAGSGGSIPGSCGVNATGQTEYNAPTSGPVQQHVNRGSQTNSYYYTVTTHKSETASWSAGGGIKLKEKAGVFVAQQIEIEASVLYTGSVQVKDSESSTVVQDLLPGYGGAIYIGDPYLRTYGDYIVNLPNLTMIVRGQWIEATSGLSAQGPVANVVDYPLE